MNSFAKKFLAFCLLVWVGGYAAYSFLLPTYRIRYRLSMDVEVDGKLKTSSNVIEISYQIMPDSLSFLGGAGGAFGGAMHGAAPTIDLGPSSQVFIIDIRPLGSAPNRERCPLLRPNGVRLTMLPLVANGFPGEGLPSTMAKYLARLQEKHGAVDVPIEILPMFVHFRDPSDPQTIEEIDPRALSTVLNRNVRLVAVRLELTQEAITAPDPDWPESLKDSRGTLARLKICGPTPSIQIYRQYFFGL